MTTWFIDRKGLFDLELPQEEQEESKFQDEEENIQEEQEIQENLDKKINCSQCKETFIFDIESQNRIKELGFKEPKLCYHCLSNNKNKEFSIKNNNNLKPIEYCCKICKKLKVSSVEDQAYLISRHKDKYIPRKTCKECNQIMSKKLF